MPSQKQCSGGELIIESESKEKMHFYSKYIILIKFRLIPGYLGMILGRLSDNFEIVSANLELTGSL